ncbi:Exportin-T [Aaosphaeria arxii CBS 175.79]|uniref:Exportin-T n=1 Tax=Aaosphaeria arxii CBS 175.79 TaxID=1450172 RepID=A0A6A5Y952_9PLEO|nr:Exportin-T [Aaosphaeria arxii CBS 175.79]KAF2021859.1 Exportin-T [Aaosphaeria arxii CBS 175.79]
MEAQVENAIEIASSPTSTQDLRGQAIEYLNSLRTDPSAWQACLSLVARDPRPPDIVRHFSLDLVNNAVQQQQLDSQSLGYVKDTLLNYIRQAYAAGSSSVDSTHMQNKIMQTMTYLFAALYSSTWQSFFDDFRAIAADQGSIGTSNTAGTILYLRVLGQVHDEIADQLVVRSEEEKRRNVELKDLIRVRDAQKISLSWQEILAKWRESDLQLIEMCLKNIGRWVSWIDISLVVNEAMISTFLEMAGQQGIEDPDSPQGKVRDAAIDTFSEIVSKKMNPAEKIELIIFLNLPNIVGQLIGSPALLDQGSSSYDNDLAETVGKLVNNIVFDIVKVLENDSTNEQTKQRADELIQVFTPYLLRFFADQYDEVCSTVIPSLTDLLTFFRKLQKKTGTLPNQYAVILPAVLDAIIGKMKYDETASWGEDDDQEGEAEFQELRKRLHVLQQTVAAIDESFYIETLSRVVGDTFARLSANDQSLTWRDLDLALYEMYLFGELAIRNSGLYAKREPSSVAAERLVGMMSGMVESDLANYPHPAIQLQYMEICVRYTQFFEQNAHLIPKVLENFVRLTHHNHIKVRSRSWYLFQRFVKPLRAQLGNVSHDIIQAVGDLLTIKAELPNESENDMSSDEEDQSADALFNSQLYLFEAVGCIASSPTVPVESKKLYAQTIMGPLFSDMEATLGQARNGDERAILQIHHNIMALGTLARGYGDWNPSSNAQAPSEVSDEFYKASEAILVALDSLSSSMQIRGASRFAFSRMLAVLGSRSLQRLPSWIEGLLSQNSTADETNTFLKVLGQLIFTFKTEIAGVLDNLLTPLLQRVFNALSVTPAGTDDEIQLAELRREYLNFLMSILSNGLGTVIVSSTNQPMFDTIITSLDTFARDTKDYPTARLSISVIVRMLAVWGGPDKIGPSANATPTSPTNTSADAIPGFDNFAVERFSPILWSVPGAPGFNVKDAQARQVLQELAGLQAEIIKKVGDPYVERLRSELQGMGSDEQFIEQYLRTLAGAFEGQKKEREWKVFFVQFVERLLGGR